MPKLRLPSRRTALKWMHWMMVPLFLWFVVVQPADVARIGAHAIQFHSVMGLCFVSLALLWTADYLRRGLASRPGPKLPPWARMVHWIMHRVLVWGLFGVALTGFLLGLTSSRLLFAGGIIPIAPPMGLPHLNDWVGLVHEIEFYTLAVIAAGHAVFHIWRHIRLRDNALRIMAPRLLYRFL